MHGDTTEHSARYADTTEQPPTMHEDSNEHPSTMHEDTTPMSRYTRPLARLGPTGAPSLATLVVVVGDLAVLLLFVVAGLYEHSIPAWEFPVYTLETLAPFALAWLVLAPFAGLYHRETLSSYRWTVVFVVLGWIFISVVGAQIRATSYFHGQAPLDFMLVNVAFGVLFLLPWRLSVVWLRRRDTRAGSHNR